jgi:acyl carrier protein
MVVSSIRREEKPEDVMSNDDTVRTAVYDAVQATLFVPAELHAGLTFVGDLGFDSLRFASLAIALENAIGRPILLNDWLASTDDPGDLTVGSLLQSIRELLAEGD